MEFKFTDAELLERASLRAAANIRGLWEETGESDVRLLDQPFFTDRLVLAGHSVAGKNRREHVVPPLFILKACHTMLEAGETDQAVARYIRDHLKIVRVSTEEAHRLERVRNLGVRHAMPIGWAPGDDIYARLVAARIEWTPVGVRSEAADGEAAASASDHAV